MSEREDAIDKMEMQLIQNFTNALSDPEQATPVLLNNARQFWESLRKVKAAEDEEQVSKLSGSMQSLSQLLKED